MLRLETLALAWLAAVSPISGHPLTTPAGLSLLWPVTPIRIVHPFDPPAEAWLPGHRGVDLATRPGQEVRAPADGQVRFAGTVVDRGVVSIELSTGTIVTIEPVEATVRSGDVIERGQRIATVATGGHCASTCIHVGVIRDGDYVSPRRVFEHTRIRLLPLTGR